MTKSEAHPENSPNEMVEEIDREGRVIRLVSRQKMRADVLRHRAVFVVVVSADGKLLVHQRAATKDIWPEWWDVAVGGVLAPGEDSRQAAHREVREEIGLDRAVLTPLGTGAYEDSNVKLQAQMYLCRADGPFTFSDGEVTSTAWVPFPQLLEWLKSHQVLPDSTALVIPLLPTTGLG